MGFLAFDTHQFIQTLSQAGMSVEQAEAISNAVRMTYAHGTFDLATKADLAMVKNDLAEARADLGGKIIALDKKITALDGRGSALESRVSILERKITDVDESVTALGVKIEVLKVQLQVLEKSLTLRLGGMLFAALGIFMVFMKYLQG